MSRPPRAPKTRISTRPAPASKGFHPRNRHQGHYDLPALAEAEPSLRAHLVRSGDHALTLDFSEPQAVKTLNCALLRHHYGIHDWDLPAGYLCPPIPGRADYLHHAADLLAADLLAAEDSGELPCGGGVQVLDIGTGANLVYPLIGQHEYGWSFVGTDIDEPALQNAERILRANPQAAAHISLQWQSQPDQILRGIIRPDDNFALTICNPPFHASLAEASAGSERKWRGLAASAERNDSPLRAARQSASRATDRHRSAPLNFGGHAAELACPGGELAFIETLIAESALFTSQVLWFSTLVSKSANLPAIYRALDRVGIDSRKTVTMAQGQKQSRFVAWSFLPRSARRDRLRAMTAAR